MHAVITAESFIAFLSYLGAGLAILVAAAVLVTLITPHREFALIRQGNTAAATAFAGTLIGIALPLHAAVSHSVSLVDAVIWGGVAAAVQLVAYLLARLASSGISRQITDNVMAGGIFSAGASIAVGLVNAAAMTP